MGKLEQLALQLSISQNNKPTEQQTETKQQEKLTDEQIEEMDKLKKAKRAAKANADFIAKYNNIKNDDARFRSCESRGICAAGGNSFKF